MTDPNVVEKSNKTKKSKKDQNKNNKIKKTLFEIDFVTPKLI